MNREMLMLVEAIARAWKDDNFRRMLKAAPKKTLIAGGMEIPADMDVIVLEKHGDFFRDFRGDTVHPSTLQMIDELGLIDEFGSTCIPSYWATARPISQDPGRRCGLWHMSGLPRM